VFFIHLLIRRHNLLETPFGTIGLALVAGRIAAIADRCHEARGALARAVGCSEGPRGGKLLVLVVGLRMRRHGE
jgi:hypothetical protein